MTEAQTPPVPVPGPSAYSVFQRNRRARLALLGCLVLAVLALNIAAPASFVLGAVAAVGVVGCAYVISKTMRAFGAAADAERLQGYTTMARLQGEQLWLLNPQTGGWAPPRTVAIANGPADAE